MTDESPQAHRRDLRLARVMVAYCLFSWVEYAIWMAVLLYAYRRGGATLAGIVGVAQLLPAAVLAPALGSLGDRLPRGRALVVAYAAQFGCLVAVAALLRSGAATPAVVVAAAATTVTLSMTRPVHYAVLPQLAATPRTLVSVNAASGVATGLGAFAGPIVAGVTAASRGVASVTVLCASAMLLAAVLCAGLRLPAPARVAGESALRAAAAGLRSVSADRAVLALLVLQSVSFVVSGTLEVLGVSFADAVLGGGGSTAGTLLGAVGIGTLGGALAAGGLAFRLRLAGPMTLGLVVAGAPLLAMVFVADPTPAVVLLAGCGLGQSFAMVAARTLLQRSTDDAVLARVFAVQEGVLFAGYALGAALAPALVAGLGAGAGYLPLGVGLVLVAAATWPLSRRLDDGATVRPDVLELLARVAFLTPMPPPALERLARSARWVEVEASDVVVRQSELGDAFYVIERGSLSVTVDGVLREHRLGAPDGFGEIALLRDVPRTATVTALTPCRLLRLERAAFLAAVTGNPDGRVIAEQVAAAHLQRDASAPQP